MRLLFIIDAPRKLKPEKDSTIALMRAAQQRGDEVHYAEMHHLLVADGRVRVQARKITLAAAGNAQWVKRDEPAGALPAGAFDAVLMRKEPPVDEAFLMTTRLLDIVARQVPVANAPRALREQNEKLSILNFPDLIPPTWVGADFGLLQQFRQAHGEVVLKPLNGMGGQGIYISSSGVDRNFRSVFDMLSGGGELIMAQAYLPAAREGDFRVFVADGAPLRWMLARIPRADDHRGNLAAGGSGEARELSREAREIAEAVAPTLAANGIKFAGLDVIGGKLIEINITCPTGLVEVAAQTGDEIAATVLEAMVGGGAG